MPTTAWVSPTSIEVQGSGTAWGNTDFALAQDGFEAECALTAFSASEQLVARFEGSGGVSVFGDPAHAAYIPELATLTSWQVRVRASKAGAGSVSDLSAQLLTTKGLLGPDLQTYAWGAAAWLEYGSASASTGDVTRSQLVTTGLGWALAVAELGGAVATGLVDTVEIRASFELGGAAGLDVTRRYARAHAGRSAAAGGVLIPQGAAVGVVSGLALPLAGGDDFLGFAMQRVDTRGLAAGARAVDVFMAGETVLEVLGAEDEGAHGATVYAADERTFTLQAVGTTPIGRVVQWMGGVSCRVRFEAAARRSG